MVTHVGVTKRDDAASVMDCAWEVEKVIPVHVGAKIRPANAVGIDVRDQKNRGRVVNLRDFLGSKPVGHRNIRTWNAFPTEKIVHGITSNTWIVRSPVTDIRRIAGTHMDAAATNIMGVEGPLWIEDPIFIRRILRNNELPLDPFNVRSRDADRNSIRDELVSMVGGIQKPGRRQLLFVIDTLNPLCALLRGLQRREENGSQNADYSNDEKEFDQGKSRFVFGPGAWLELRSVKRHQIHLRADRRICSMKAIRYCGCVISVAVGSFCLSNRLVGCRFDVLKYIGHRRMCTVKVKRVVDPKRIQLNVLKKVVTSGCGANVRLSMNGSN